MQPNFVWITSEDNSKHYLKLFDPNGVSTPNIEHLAKQGITYQNAFSNAPVCSVARSTLIAGCYAPRLGFQFHRKTKSVPLPESLKMFPAYLKDAGYYTSNKSKEDYNIIKPDGTWDASSKQASWKNRKEDQPFFHMENIGTTHESSLHVSIEKMEEQIPTARLESTFIQPNHPQTKTFQCTNAYYKNRIQQMDQQVGNILKELEEDGLLENTFIFYFGDHGGVLPDSKGYLSETGLHIPLVVYIPPTFRHLVQEAPGSQTDHFVSFIDFGVTLLNLAGIKAPEGIDGQPFLGPNLSAMDLENRSTYGYADRFDEKYDFVRSVRKGKYKYIRNFSPFYPDGLVNNYRYKQLAYQEWLELYQNKALSPIQSAFFRPKAPEYLFDVEADPYETINLAEQPANQDIKLELRAMLNDWVLEMPDLSFYPEYYLVEHAFSNPRAFGQKHQKDIQAYLEIANLSLETFNSIAPQLEQSLTSEDPWKRYWGLITCSTFGEQANSLVNLVKDIAQNDPIRINRVRAAEFLGILGKPITSELLCQHLYQSNNPVEALLILNTIVFLQDFHQHQFQMELDNLQPAVAEDKLVYQRLKYLGLR